jgi:hypothetical protein
LLPIPAIIFVLAVLNLEHVVFNIMGGLGQAEPSSADERYSIVIGLAFISVFLAPILLIAWITLSITRSSSQLL